MDPLAALLNALSGLVDLHNGPNDENDEDIMRDEICSYLRSLGEWIDKSGFCPDMNKAREFLDEADIKEK